MLKYYTCSVPRMHAVFSVFLLFYKQSVQNRLLQRILAFFSQRNKTRNLFFMSEHISSESTELSIDSQDQIVKKLHYQLSFYEPLFSAGLNPVHQSESHGGRKNSTAKQNQTIHCSRYDTTFSFFFWLFYPFAFLFLKKVS